MQRGVAESEGVIVLPERPRLRPPTTAVRTSYLVGEQADVVQRGSDAGWLHAASLDFDGYVAARTGVVERWGVPSTLYWFTAGEFYLGSLVIRHALLRDELGGHIGYHVVLPWQRQGHATTMLGDALALCRDAGLARVLLTVAPANVASTRVVQRHGGVADGTNREGDVRWWVSTAAGSPDASAASSARDRP